MRSFLLQNKFFFSVELYAPIVGNYIFLMFRLSAVVDPITGMIVYQ